MLDTALTCILLKQLMSQHYRRDNAMSATEKSTPTMQALLRRCPLSSLLAACTVLILSACGGGQEATVALKETALVRPEITAVRLPTYSPSPANEDKEAGITASAPSAPSALEAPPLPFNGGVEDAGLLMLLIPDDLSTSSAGVAAWVDAASETGTRIAPITDAQFLAMGTDKAAKYAGLVLPDQMHVLATDEVVSAIRSYVTAGGRALLTYDFGALTLNANNQPVYPIPKSRLSDLAGVDYVLYDALLGQMVGLGPVVGKRSTLRELLVPPGKSMPYNVPPTAAAAQSPATADAAARTTKAGKLSQTGVLGAAGLAAGEALYLPTNTRDPGGLTGFDPQQFQNVPAYSVQDRQSAQKGQQRPRSLKIDFGRAFKGRGPAFASRLPTSGLTQHGLKSVATEAAGAVTRDAVSNQAALLSAQDTLDGYHGYLLGHLIYPTFVTTGSYTGVQLVISPSFGLVAGINTVGAGKVLFVNMPLGYLKGRTDALPMHGFLRYFLEHVVKGARLSAMPNGKAGMTLDWHLDWMAAQPPSLALEAAGIFNTHTFSMEMTAGPDTIVPGDGLGWNLNNNPVAQQLLRRLDARGHAIGSHGGWIHDYYGLNATESNAAQFLPYLVLNKSAVDAAAGRPMRGYSAPQGNNPPWAMDWLEQQGVVAAYFGGHTGLGATRQYRDGALRNPAL